MAPARGPRRFALLPVIALVAAVSACSMGGPRISGEAEPAVGAAAPSPARAAGGSYNVIAGDTIYVVARKFGVTVRALIDANGLQPPFQLSPGQVLRLPTGGDYMVVKGDTLSKVARRTGVEFATLARMNNLSPPYRIRIGQRLMLPTGATGGTEEVSASGDTTVIQSPNANQPAVTAAPIETMKVEALPAPTKPPKETTTFGTATRPGLVTEGAAPPAPGSAYKPLAQRELGAPAPSDAMKSETIASPSAGGKPAAVEPLPPPVQTAPAPSAPARTQTAAATPAQPAAAATGLKFIWPVHGPVLMPFGAMAKGQHNDGVNIAVPKGTPVLAAADGEVAYAGNELRGFGNLLLIKHTGTDFVTAYAHNERLLVHRGEHVRKGQKIALSGDTGGVGQPQLHFELRQGARAIDPQTLLPPELSPAASPAAQQDPG